MKHAPLYTRTYDLTCWLVFRMDECAARRWPQIANRVMESAFGLLNATTIALSFPSGRAHAREQADHEAARLRVVLRVAAEVGALSNRQHTFAASELTIIGRMLGGWSRSDHRRKRRPIAAQATGAEPVTAPTA